MPATTPIPRPIDDLHNRNCYNYLSNVKFTESIIGSLHPEIQLKLIGMLYKAYDPGFAYADLYTAFFDYIEENIHRLDSAPVDELDAFIVSLYDNDNGNLENTFAKIKHIPDMQTPSSPPLKHSIKAFLTAGEKEQLNTQSISPVHADSAQQRFKSVHSREFKPQHTTSIATVRHYAYQQEGGVRELRFGTQGQRHRETEEFSLHGRLRVSPLFECFLGVLEKRNKDSGISHIYFNNLGRDADTNERRKESELTAQLHDLENRHRSVAVITLPADKGLMNEGDYTKTEENHDLDAVKEELLQIAAQEEGGRQSVKDFYISQKIRERLFTGADGSYSPAAEKAKLEELLENSCQAMGISGGNISSARRQALWFHFIKFELTNHIITTLNPQSINFSCKDAIDRAGVSSTYYNLIKSFAGPIPMTREEFDRGLHAAPAMVKARGMNSHLQRIWNVVDSYVNANYGALKNQGDKAWLIEWRDSNCPHERVAGLLRQRIKECQREALTIKQHRSSPLIAQIVGVLGQIDMLKEVSGQRLLLEATMLTMKFIAPHQNARDIMAYEKVANAVFDGHRKSKLVGGALRAALGAITMPMARIRGEEPRNLEQGLATIKSGLRAEEKSQLQIDMKQLLAQLREGPSTASATPPPPSF